jgi:stage II sporulation protein R
MIFVGCGVNDKEVIRIHIRANSNSSYDQEVKLSVRDKVVDFITPLIAECLSCEEVKECLTDNLNRITDVVDCELRENGFEYQSHARINNEYFPSRKYGDKVFPADYYDALIIELGSGQGDNWWCVAYPPLCFVGYENGNIGNIQYKSKSVELINNFFGE